MKTEQIKMLILKEHTMKKNYIKLGLTLLSVMNFFKKLMIIILRKKLCYQIDSKIYMSSLN